MLVLIASTPELGQVSGEGGMRGSSSVWLLTPFYARNEIVPISRPQLTGKLLAPGKVSHPVTLE
jgi:hypothetical protein